MKLYENVTRRGRLMAALMAIALAMALMISPTGALAKKKSKNTPAPTAVTTEAPTDASLYDVFEGESYTLPEDVALYLCKYHALPVNFITKSAARKLGWDSSKGNLWSVAPGMSIGGDRFGNYEGRLPVDGDYRECDVNFDGGYRGAERIIYDVTDWDIYYTDDHYNTFILLYGVDEDGTYYGLPEGIESGVPEPTPAPTGKKSK